MHSHMRELQKSQYLFLQDNHIEILEFTEDELRNPTLMAAKE